MFKRISKVLPKRLASFGQSSAKPTQDFPEFPEFTTFEEIYKYSIENHEDFWKRIAKTQIKWDKEFTITGKRL
jgi:hypothetical protein